MQQRLEIDYGSLKEAGYQVKETEGIFYEIFHQGKKVISIVCIDEKIWVANSYMHLICDTATIRMRCGEITVQCFKKGEPAITITPETL